MPGLPPGLAQALRAARSVVALTGSGISAESGVPIFREAQTGLWERYDPQELATPEAFMRDPELVWKWYAWRRGLIDKAGPNSGHLALAQMERKISSFALVTQNVDGRDLAVKSGTHSGTWAGHGGRSAASAQLAAERNA